MKKNEENKISFENFRYAFKSQKEMFLDIQAKDEVSVKSRSCLSLVGTLHSLAIGETIINHNGNKAKEYFHLIACAYEYAIEHYNETGILEDTMDVLGYKMLISSILSEDTTLIKRACVAMDVANPHKNDYENLFAYAYKELVEINDKAAKEYINQLILMLGSKLAAYQQVNIRYLKALLEYNGDELKEALQEGIKVLNRNRSTIKYMKAIYIFGIFVIKIAQCRGISIEVEHEKLPIELINSKKIIYSNMAFAERIKALEV